MFNLFHRKTAVIGFCSHAELFCAYRFVVNLHSAALYRNLAGNDCPEYVCWALSPQPDRGGRRGRSPRNY